jgi:zinc protease
MVRLIIFILSLIMLINQTDALSKDKKKSNKIFPYPSYTETLQNGLKVILIPMPSDGLVSYYSIVRTGSRDEYEPGHSGFAHFFEHMMFRGTKKYPGNVYDKIVISMGADANAYTTDDYTCYHLSITKDNLEKVMELESDRFQNLFYEEPAFKTESGAVYGEYRKGKTSPFFWIWEKLLSSAFTKHTYKHTTIGFEEDIKAMPTMYDYSISFFNRYYRPENVVLLIVGDINPKEIMPMVKSYYGEWKKGYVPPKIETEPKQTAEIVSEVKYSGKSLPILSIAYKGSAYNPGDKEVLSAMLLGDLAFGENSALFKKLYIKEQKVQFLEPQFQKNRDPFLWIVWAMVNDEKDLNYVKSEILSTAEYYKNNLVSKSELENLKKRLKYMYLMNLDTPSKVAGSLAREIAITTSVESIDINFATLEKLTPEDIQKAAKKYFNTDQRTIVTLKGSM